MEGLNKLLVGQYCSGSSATKALVEAIAGNIANVPQGDS